jgi:hypothetical protein
MRVTVEWYFQKVVGILVAVGSHFGKYPVWNLTSPEMLGIAFRADALGLRLWSLEMIYLFIFEAKEQVRLQKEGKLQAEAARGHQAQTSDEIHIPPPPPLV